MVPYTTLKTIPRRLNTFCYLSIYYLSRQVSQNESANIEVFGNALQGIKDSQKVFQISNLCRLWELSVTVRSGKASWRCTYFPYLMFCIHEKMIVQQLVLLLMSCSIDWEGMRRLINLVSYRNKFQILQLRFAPRLDSGITWAHKTPVNLLDVFLLLIWTLLFCFCKLVTTRPEAGIKKCVKQFTWFNIWLVQGLQWGHSAPHRPTSYTQMPHTRATIMD